MQFELSQELTQMRDALRKFVKAELEPLEKSIDATGESKKPASWAVTRPA